MIKRLLIPILAAVFLASCNSSSSDNPPVIAPSGKTTFMVYLPGTDLEANHQVGNGNIDSMLKATASDKLNIVIQTGAGNVNYGITPAPADKPIHVKDWTRVKRFDIKNKILTERSDLGKSCFEYIGETKDCVEMGTPAALTSFIKYSVANYPADRYILVLWDHGGGAVNGYGGNHVRPMDTNELMQALAAAGNVKFDIIGFDACLMATAEIAYNLRRFGKYLVASEELEAGKGWDYSVILSAIAKNPSISSLDIGKSIVDGFIAFNKTDKDSTLSVIDMSQTEHVVAELERLSRTLLPLFKANQAEHWINIFNARSSTEEFGTLASLQTFFNEIDIVDFTNSLTYFSDNEYKAAVEPLAAAVNRSVLYNKVNEAHPSSKGMSLYFPFNFTNDNPGAALLKRYNNIYYTNKSASFAPTFTTLLSELISYADNTPTELSASAPVISGNDLTVAIRSNFGVHHAQLLVNNSTTADVFEFYVSDIAKIVQISTVDLELSAKSDGAVLTLNGTPTYMRLAARNQIGLPNVFDFEIPIYVNPAANPQQTLEAYLFVSYDFEKNESAIQAVQTINNNWRQALTLQTGDVITLTTVTAIKDLLGNYQLGQKPSTTTITITNAENPNLVVKREQIAGMRNSMAFQVLNMKGDNLMTPFFSKTRNLSEYTVGEMQAISDALNKPIK